MGRKKNLSNSQCSLPGSQYLLFACAAQLNDFLALRKKTHFPRTIQRAKKAALNWKTKFTQSVSGCLPDSFP